MEGNMWATRNRERTKRKKKNQIKRPNWQNKNYFINLFVWPIYSISLPPKVLLLKIPKMPIFIVTQVIDGHNYEWQFK